MAELNFKYKGQREFYLTRYFDPYSDFTPFKDDVGFMDENNPFSDFISSSTCGNWETDKIKFLSIPDKGFLFYLTNPQSTPAIYDHVQVGQEILTRNLIAYNVLGFNGEGLENNQYTENYLTEFSFERMCSGVSSDVIFTVKLNMITTNNT